jgi:hypothetical protein
MSSSTSADPPISTLGIYVDPTMSVKGNIRAIHTVATAVGFIQKKVAEHVTQTYNLDPPLAPMDLRGRYFPAGKLSIQTDRLPTNSKCHLSPGAEPNVQLSVVGNGGLTALFSPNDEQSRRIQDRITHLARQEKENLVLAETNKRLSNALVDDIKTPSNLASGSRKSEFHHLNQGLHADRRSFQSNRRKQSPQSRILMVG